WLPGSSVNDASIRQVEPSRYERYGSGRHSLNLLDKKDRLLGQLIEASRILVAGCQVVSERERDIRRTVEGGGAPQLRPTELGNPSRSVGRGSPLSFAQPSRIKPRTDTDLLHRQFPAHWARRHSG